MSLSKSFSSSDLRLLKIVSKKILDIIEILIDDDESKYLCEKIEVVEPPPKKKRKIEPKKKSKKIESPPKKKKRKIEPKKKKNTK